MTMQNFDLNKVLSESGMAKERMAKELFPSNKYPVKALERVLDGHGKLDTDQLAQLAKLLKVSIPDLFKGLASMVSREGVHTITIGDYTAELDFQKAITQVFHNGVMVHTEVLHSQSIPLSEYLHQLQTIILKHNQSNLS
jgi:hypothetical protein